MKTHSAITHPALRHRMAQALNELRHEHLIYRPDIDIVAYCRRQALKDACERMAALEQSLDDAQEARIFGTIPS